jgi:TRL-like protein family
MRQLFALGVIGLGLLGLTGCQPVAAPVMGILSLDTKYGWVATTNANATKEGKACATTVMGLVASGDASIAAAKAAGGITEVSSIDHSAKSLLGITAEWCTIVKGK